MEGFEALLDLSDVVLYVGIMIWLLPYLIAVVVKSSWSPIQKKVAQYALCLAASLGWFVYSGNFNTGDLARMLLLIVAGSQIVYVLNKRALKAVEERIHNT